jgi:hypothetical protein
MVVMVVMASTPLLRLMNIWQQNKRMKNGPQRRYEKEWAGNSLSACFFVLKKSTQNY